MAHKCKVAAELGDQSLVLQSNVNMQYTITNGTSKQGSVKLVFLGDHSATFERCQTGSSFAAQKELNLIEPTV